MIRFIDNLPLKINLTYFDMTAAFKRCIKLYFNKLLTG